LQGKLQVGEIDKLKKVTPPVEVLENIEGKTLPFAGMVNRVIISVTESVKLLLNN